MWTVARRALLLMFAMGLMLSVSSSARVSARTVVDGMISFAFLPVSEALALSVVYLKSDRRVPFVGALEQFFASNTPWLLWILAFCVWQALLSPWSISDTTVKIIIASLLVPACWAAYLDLHFFRAGLSRPGAAAAIDLAIARGVGWTSAVAYFFGIALWARIVAWLR
jgi:hypothetical protein